MINFLRSYFIVLLLIAFVPVDGAFAVASTDKSLKILHFVLKDISFDKAHEIVDEAKNAGFSTIQVLLTDGLILDKAPWKTSKNAWTKDKFLSWITYIRMQGLDFIPEIKLLTHQEKFFQDRYPNLMFNKSTYDPRNESTYLIVFSLIDEILEAINPKAIHIGHDELAGFSLDTEKKWLNPNEEILPASLFLQHINRIHNYLKQKKVATWIWGDMLISPNEFPNMRKKDLHGNLSGYAKELRNQLPRDIVICDWHYADEQPNFPTLSKLQEEGFKVIGVTWKNQKTIRNFSRYAKNHNAYGMMATTWFHVQRNEMELVKWIIQTSGLLFQNPDATVSPQPK